MKITLKITALILSFTLIFVCTAPSYAAVNTNSFSTPYGEAESVEYTSVTTLEDGGKDYYI